MSANFVLGLIAAAVLVSWVPEAAAHGGGLNAQGCHNNRKTGDYHCHRAPAAAPAPTPRPVAASAPKPTTLAPTRARAVDQAPKRTTDEVYYANCSAARAAGAAPVYRGDPGYAAHLDRDNDGVGCE